MEREGTELLHVSKQARELFIVNTVQNERGLKALALPII